MAKKISELPAASSVTSADLVPIVQSGVTKKATAAMVAGTPVAPAVVVVTAATRTVQTSDVGKYLRFTAAGAKVAYFDPDLYSVNDEVHIANRSSSGNLTLHPIASYLTLRPPKSGTLVLEPGDTVTVKMVDGDSHGVDAADVFGSTSNA